MYLIATLNAKYIHTNLAIRLLYQLNKEQHPELSWREFTINQDFDGIAEQCADFEFVAFSCYIWNISQTLEVAQHIKKRNPNCKILLGGPEVSYDWEEVIVRPEVDFIIAGEGELPFSAFLKAFPGEVHGVPGLIWKTVDGVWFENPKPGGTFDLSAYEYIMPYADDAPETLANRVLYIETSRGCPYKCEFCLASLDNKVRYLPDPHIKNTLLFMMEHGRVVKFLDRTFNIKKAFTLDIFDFILTHHRPGKNVFQFEITADILHPDIVAYIQERVPSGLIRFEIGIQTVNQVANRAVSRKQDFEKTKAIIHQLRDKIEMHLDLIVGLPFDGPAELRQSFEEVFALYPPELQLGFLKFLKGTPMLYKHAEHAYVFDPNPPYQIIESAYMSRQDLANVELVEHALEIYWNKPRAPRTLRYAAEKIGIYDFLYGLGQFFSTKKPFHQYTAEDVFDILHGFVLEKYPNQTTLHELAALDYYLFYRRCPKERYLMELPRSEKFALLESRGFDHSKSRFRVLHLGFDLQQWQESGIIDEKPSRAIVRYAGDAEPELAFV